MIKWTLSCSLTLIVFTRFCLVIQRMILLFFPTMWLETWGLKDTAFFVVTYKSAWFPIITYFIVIVVKDMRFSSEVLPVMSIVTLSFIMLFRERTPLCLKIEQVVVLIFCHQMDLSWLQIWIWMCKRTVFAIVTLIKTIWEHSTKLSFILFNMIKSLNSTMSKITFITMFTKFSLCLGTHISYISSILSSSIFDSVIKFTMFVIMLMLKLTWFYFKLI
jgi:hypothetical protein